MSTERKMRAKVRVVAISPITNVAGKVIQERLMLAGVAKRDGYPTDGSDEDNSFARFTPSASFDMLIANPALVGSFEVGATFYADFIPVDAKT